MKNEDTIDKAINNNIGKKLISAEEFDWFC